MSELPLSNYHRNQSGQITYTLTKLRKIVLSIGLPQYQIASISGIHPYTFSLYVQGKKEISDKHLAALSKALDLPPEEIIGTEEYPIKNPDSG